MTHRFLISATASGCGKTTVSIGLMRAMKRRSLKVAPFKCGPDYIDTQFHGTACGRQSVNLDSFMSSADHIRTLFAAHSAGADVSVVEGVMGLFDGYDRWDGSAAETASLLDIPVILIVNAASTAYSAGALIHGFKSFSDKIKVAGVIFNNVGSLRHAHLLEAACRDTGTECFGFLPKIKTLETPSRHLGLTLSTKEKMEHFADLAADAVEQNIDIDRLLAATAVEPETLSSSHSETPAKRPMLRVAVARDEAFSFIYQANIDALLNHERYNIEIRYFSPMRDTSLPEADIVYLPGGYPELFAETLAENVSMRKSITEYAAAGGRMLAECGGFMYLCQNVDGHPMCGVLPMHSTMEGARLRLGYRTLEFEGFKMKGHEFHYSTVTDSEAMPSICREFDAAGNEVATAMYHHGNVFAGYTHLYWAEGDILKLWNL